MTGELWVALAGVLVGGAGVLSGHLTARRASADARGLAADERDHTRRLAHDERVFGGRSQAYLETLRYLQWRWAFIERTHPVGPAREPPPPPSDEDLVAAEALIGAFGSKPIRRAVYDFGTLAAQFKGAVREYEAAQGDAARSVLRDTINRRRQEAWAKLREIQALIQFELTGEEMPEPEDG